MEGDPQRLLVVVVEKVQGGPEHANNEDCGGHVDVDVLTVEVEDMFLSPGGEEGHGVWDRPWPWHRSEAWGRRYLDGPQSAGGRCLGDVILMLDYSNGDDDVFFLHVEDGNRGREDLGEKNKSH